MVKGGIFLGKRYEVLSKIGTGGMADVYKGRDIMLNRFVAIKVLKKEYREDENFVKKFRSEAQAAAGLTNPNIVNVYDVGEDRGLYYMVMELVEGTTLKDYIRKKGKLTSREVISIAIQVCSGIEAAHDKQIVHRDIKPQNIMISKEGKVKVMDFGIARAITSNTVSSSAMGSVHYVSPEQARGGFCDEKSDIYSVGVTMYEMITGKVPFDGETTVEVAMKHLQEPLIPPSVYAPHVSGSLEDIIEKCMQKSSERRYQNMGQLISDLKRSLIDPDGNFVDLGSKANLGNTVIVSQKDLNRLKKQSIREEEEEEEDFDADIDDDDEDEDDDSYDRRRSTRGKKEEVTPKMNKMMKILTIIVAVIILFVMLFLIGKAVGILKLDKNDTKVEETTGNIEVPNLLGEKEEVAAEMCKKKNLEMTVTSRENSDQPEGTVIRQNLNAGEKVAKKTVIEVVISSGAKEVTVEDVSGYSQDDAWARLKEQGFTDYEIQTEYSSEQANGDVIKTIPGKGETTTVDTKIVIVISKGAEKKTVPSIVGMSKADAEKAILDNGFVVGAVSSTYDDSVPAGVVISQTVNKGKKIDAGSEIGYVYSDGPKPKETVPVPSVLGKTLASAKSALSNVGLSYTEKEVDSPSQYGIVVDVSPAEGESVEVGTTITLYYSNGALSEEKKPETDSGNNTTGNEP